MASWVVSRHAQVAWIGEQLEIRSGDSPEPCVTPRSEQALAVLDWFRRPADPEELIRHLDEAFRGPARTLIGRLAGIGVLVPEGDVRAATPCFSLPASPGAPEQPGRALDFLRYDDAGLTVTSCGKENLSRGCQTCKEGAWLCVFVGLRCNALCAFCPQPASARTIDEASFGTAWVDDLLEALDVHGGSLRGISYSGGEPFLYEDNVRRIATFVRARFPSVYQWVYTNGLLANADALRRFRDFGLDEIRFNLCASSFDAKVLDRIRDHAVTTFPWVSVEVPMYEVTYHHLIERGILRQLDEMGVRQLNLGQLFTGTPSSAATRSFGDYFCTPSGRNGGAEILARYRQWTHDVFAFVRENDLAIRVNDCSDDAKTLQTFARREIGGSAMLALMDRAYPRPARPRSLLEPPPGAERTHSGLAFQRLAKGDSAGTASLSPSVPLRFIGWTATGEVSLSSYRAGLEPAICKVSDLPPGLAEAVMEMTRGERRLVWVPGNLSGGGLEGEERPVAFDVELVDVIPAEPPAAPSTA